jgi:hypothetical protein
MTMNVMPTMLLMSDILNARSQSSANEKLSRRVPSYKSIKSFGPIFFNIEFRHLKKIPFVSFGKKLGEWGL